MIEKELDGVEFVTANTDAQALQHSKAAAKIQMGVKATEGLGAGARPTVGASAAEETIEEIVDQAPAPGPRRSSRKPRVSWAF